MNGHRAKRLRRDAYGDLSLKAPRMYVVTSANDKTAFNHPSSPPRPLSGAQGVAVTYSIHDLLAYGRDLRAASREIKAFGRNVRWRVVLHRALAEKRKAVAR